MDTEQFECLAAQALVGRYLTGDDLPPESQAELEGHLETCTDCRELLAKKKAELLLALQTESAEPSPATADSSEPEREVVANTAAEEPPASVAPTSKELTPAQISAMMNPTEAVPAGVELVFDDAELPAASPELDPVAPIATPVAEVPVMKSAPSPDDILATGLDESDLDELLGNMPEPYVPPAPDPALVAAKEATEVESATEPEALEEPSDKEKPRIRVRVEGLPILLGKNLKTLAYSASLGLVLVAMTSFAKNPSTVFGDRALAAKTDAHATTPDKKDHGTTEEPTKGHEEPKNGEHATEEKPKTDEHGEIVKPAPDEHATEDKPKADEHSNADEHAEQTPDEHAEPKKDDIVNRMNKFESKAEREARLKKAAGEHASEPSTKKSTPSVKKSDSHSSPRVSQPDSYMVARPSGSRTTHAKPDSHGTTPKATKVHKPTTRVTKTPRSKPVVKPPKRTASKPAPKKPAKPAGLKIYDEHGNPIN